MKVLLTGIAGTGKTTVLAELQKRGYVVIDLDATGMCRWANTVTGELTEYGPDGRDRKWLNEHEWRCDTGILKKLLSCMREDKDVFVAGFIDNIEDVVQEFDKIFMLVAADAAVKERLSARTNSHFGKKEDEQEAILGWKAELTSKAKDFTEVDSNRPPEEVAEFILSNLRG